MNNKTNGKIGSVIEVDSERVIIEVSKELSNYNIIYKGNLYRIGQIGSFIKIVTGLSCLYGIVESFSTFLNSGESILDKKVIHLSLIGFRNVKGVFESGSKITPNINDIAYIIEEEDIDIIFKSNVHFPIKIGNNYYASQLPVFVNLNEFVLKHSFIVGSTGTGKSNTVAYLLSNIINEYPSSRILIIDIHGEYMHYMNEKAKEFSIYSSDRKLVIPYWMLDFETLCKFFGMSSGNVISNATDVFRDRIMQMKTAYIDSSEISDKISHNEININSPVPFKINDIWYEFYWRGYGTFNGTDRTFSELAFKKDEKGNNLIGNSEKLIKPEFEPYTTQNSFPYKSNETNFRNIADKMYKLIKDDNYEFMFGNNDFIIGKKKISELIANWIDNEKQITILNLSGIPYQILDVVIGIITNLVFDVVYYSLKINKPVEGRPILMCFEEAHRYLNTNNDGSYSINSVERVMKEGRKFGIGAMIISQRPVEISKTIISQVSTFIALRLSNSDDQAQIKSFAPINFSFFLKSLPSLSTGVAFVIGESMHIPMKIKIPLLESVKNIEFDKRIKVWKEKRNSVPDYSQTIERWMKK